MYSDDFLHAVHEVLELEGVLSDDPTDRGGLTKYGITHTLWDAWLKKYNKDYPASVADIDKNMAISVYWEEFWESLKIGSIGSRLIETELFEAAVNVSPARAAKMFQNAINYCRTSWWEPIRVDGKIGPVTLEKARALITSGYELPLYKAMNGEQYIWYKTIDDPNHSRGWTRRLPGEERQSHA